MPLAKHDNRKTSSTNAIELLKQDHADVIVLFSDYESLSDRSSATKRKLADKICLALTKHAEVEEEIFYPAVRKAVKGIDDLVDEALVEHAAAKELIEQIMAMDTNDDLFDAKIKVLSEQIEHHVREEEDKIFPQACETSLDMDEIGQKITSRKNAIKDSSTKR